MYKDFFEVRRLRVTLFDGCYQKIRLISVVRTAEVITEWPRNILGEVVEMLLGVVV